MAFTRYAWSNEMHKRNEAEANRRKLRREACFEAFYASRADKQDSMFHVPGLNFCKFTSSKIIFTFRPRRLVRFVREKVIFSCTLVHRTTRWSLKQDTFPANYKAKIYNLFYADAVTDSNLVTIIMDVYGILKRWAKKEHHLKKKKFLRYQRGEDVHFDKEDEELILDEEIKGRRMRKNK